MTLPTRHTSNLAARSMSRSFGPTLRHGGLTVVGALALGLALGCSDEKNTEGSGPQRPADGGPSADGSKTPDSAASAEDAASPADSFERLQLTVEEYVFDARAAGPEDGELVLLLHGFPETSYEWRSQLRALANAGYRAVAPDQRGYSPGARPEEVEAYGATYLVLDVLGMADALGRDSFHLVGHDWGGGVAWGLAGAAPARVTTLTILSTPHPAAFISALQNMDSCQYAASAYFDIVTQEDVTADVLLTNRTFADGLEDLSDDAQAEYDRTVLSDPAAFRAAANWYRANIEDRVFTTPAGEITVPTLYLLGSDDPFFCRDTAEASAGHVTGSYRFTVLEGEGHWLAELADEEVNRALLAHVRGTGSL